MQIGIKQGWYYFKEDMAESKKKNLQISAIQINKERDDTIFSGIYSEIIKEIWEKILCSKEYLYYEIVLYG